MSIFALLFLVAAFILAVVTNPHVWWIPALIAIGIVLALVVTHGTMVTVH